MQHLYLHYQENIPVKFSVKKINKLKVPRRALHSSTPENDLGYEALPLQLLLHKGDSDKWELHFMGTGFWGNLHACYFYLLNGAALRIKGIFFSLKVYPYILSSSQKPAVLCFVSAV